METIHLIDRPSRFDARTVGILILLVVAAIAAGSVIGRVIDVENQVLAMVIIDVMLITGILCFYDLTFAVIFWFYALTFILRYTRLDLPGIPDMSGPRFMVLVMIAVFFLQVVLGQRRPLRPSKIETTMAVFLVVHLVDIVRNSNLVRPSPLTTFANAAIIPFLIYYLVRNVCVSDRAVRRLLLAFAILQIHLALTGIFEHFKIQALVYPPDILDPTAGGGRWYGVRIRGPYLSTPLYGAALAMGFFLTLHVFNHVRGTKRWFFGIALLATPLSCLYTLTRQVWLGFALPFLSGLFASRRQRLPVALIAFLGLAGLVMVNWGSVVDMNALESRAKEDRTGESRIALAVAASQMFMDHPLVGVGLNRWREEIEIYRRNLGKMHTIFGEVDPTWARGADAHNTVLRVAVELGVVGLIPYLLIYFFALRASWKLFRRLPPNGLYGRELIVAYWQLSLAYIVCLMFVDPSQGEFLPAYFYTWTAIIERRAELLDEQDRVGEIPGYTLAAPRA